MSDVASHASNEATSIGDPTEQPAGASSLPRSPTIAQHTALAALADGQSIRDAATSAGIHRATLSRWLKSDPCVRAAYNAWRKEMIDSTRGRLLRTAEIAAATVHKAIEKGDGRLALALLNRLGLADPASIAPGASEAELALNEIAIERVEESNALKSRFKRTTELRFWADERRHLEELCRESEDLIDASEDEASGSDT